MLGLLITLVQLLGLVTAARAIMEARTAQGAVAWAIALVSFPETCTLFFIAAITQAKSRTAADLHSRSLAFRFAVRAARLTAPVQ